MRGIRDDSQGFGHEWKGGLLFFFFKTNVMEKAVARASFVGSIRRVALGT